MIVKFLIGFLLLFSVDCTFANSLKNIRINQMGNKVQIVLDVDTLTAFQQFSLASPPRIVLDMPNMKRLSKAGLTLNSGPVQSIRTGYKKDNVLRIVTDLRIVAKVNIYTLPASGKYGNRIVLDVYKTQNDSVLTLSSLEGDQMPYVIFAGKTLDGKGTVHQNIADEVVLTSAVSNKVAVERKINAQGRIQEQRTTAVSHKNINKDITICIDPGHGGKDPGAHSTVTGLKEKDAVLAIGKKLRDILNAKKGYKAFMTRDRDVFIPLYNRSKLCRKAGGDLFVSIHADAVRSKAPSGSSVYILSTHGATSQLAKYLAKSENSVDLKWGVDVSKYDDDIRQALLNIQQEATLESSDIVAKHTIEALGQIGNIHKASVERANFVVLRAPEIPSMLVETAFISNPSEARLLAKSSYQRKIALGIAKGIEEYFEEHLPQHLLLVN